MATCLMARLFVGAAQTKQLVLRLARALYTDRLRKLVALLPADITEEVLAANAKISGVVTGFSEN